MPPQALPSAGLIRRLLAMVYDGLLLLGISFAYGVVVTLARNLMGQDGAETPAALTGAMIFVGWWLVLSAYFVLSWVRQGQTLGMKSWRLRVDTLAGGRPGWRQGWLRCLLAQVSAAALGLGYLWCWLDRRGCWHDIWTRTRVVVLPRANKKGKNQSPSGGAAQ